MPRPVSPGGRFEFNDAIRTLPHSIGACLGVHSILCFFIVSMMVSCSLELLTNPILLPPATIHEKVQKRASNCR